MALLRHILVGTGGSVYPRAKACEIPESHVVSPSPACRAIIAVVTALGAAQAAAQAVEGAAVSALLVSPSRSNVATT